jgi:hypothetical protein
MSIWGKSLFLLRNDGEDKLPYCAVENTGWRRSEIAPYGAVKSSLRAGEIDLAVGEIVAYATDKISACADITTN